MKIFKNGQQKQFSFRALLPDGQVLVCLGDEPYNEVCRKYVVPCDWLLSELFAFMQKKKFSNHTKSITVLSWMPANWQNN